MLKMLLPVALIGISFVFARAAILSLRYYKLLKLPESDLGVIYREKYPVLFSIMKVAIPIVVVGFSFCWCVAQSRSLLGTQTEDDML